MQWQAQDGSPMKMARAVMERAFKTPEGLLGLREWRGDYFAWDGTGWAHKDEDWVRKQLWLELEDAQVIVQTAQGALFKPYAPNKAKVSDVMDAVKALVKLDVPKIPAWIEQGIALFDPAQCVVMADCIVDVKATAENYERTGNYDWVMAPPTSRFFTTGRMSVGFDPQATCPTWERCMKEWGAGDPAWEELRERAYGYAMMSGRPYAKFLLEFGKARGGKGTGTNDVLGRIMPRPDYMGIMLEELAQRFGLDGVENAKTLVISEINEPEDRQKERLESVLKVMLGGDEVTVDVKYKRQMKHVVLSAFPILQGNKMLRLKDAGMGLSSKMLALSFDHSWAGREDWGLRDKLGGELDGIAVRFLRALVRLTAEPDPSKKFVMPDRCLAIVKAFKNESNLWDWFLDTHFVMNRTGFVHGDTIRQVRSEWERATGQVLKTKEGTRVSDQNLLMMLEHQSGWALRRRRETNVKGGGVRGLEGLSLKGGLV